MFAEDPDADQCPSGEPLGARQMRCHHTVQQALVPGHRVARVVILSYRESVNTRHSDFVEVPLVTRSGSKVDEQFQRVILGEFDAAFGEFGQNGVCFRCRDFGPSAVEYRHLLLCVTVE